MFEIYNGRKVLVTGHTGFKGSWLTATLRFLKAKVGGFALAPNTDPSHYLLLNFENISSTLNNIKNREALEESVYNFQPEIIFHLAAQPLVRESYLNPVETYQTNVIGTLNLLEAARRCDSVRAVVIITTDKVYENKEWIFPYREVDELGGHDMYSSSKACCEILVRSYRNSFLNISDYGKDHHKLIATARAGNVIGGGDWSKDRLIPDLVRAAAENKKASIRNPNAVRPWQHVLDCINGYLLLGKKLLENRSEYADAWNFAPFSFDSKTVGEVTTSAGKIWPAIDVEFGDPGKNFHEAHLLKLDNTKSISKLGWKPLWDTDTSIRKTIDWYKCYYNEGSILTMEQVEHFFNCTEKL